MSRLRTFVFISHHYTHRLALLQQQFVIVRPTPPTRPAAPVTRMGFAMFLPMRSPESEREWAQMIGIPAAQLGSQHHCVDSFHYVRDTALANACRFQSHAFIG
jgi:hypothetical protein